MTQDMTSQQRQQDHHPRLRQEGELTTLSAAPGTPGHAALQAALSEQQAELDSFIAAARADQQTRKTGKRTKRQAMREARRFAWRTRWFDTKQTPAVRSAPGTPGTASERTE